MSPDDFYNSEDEEELESTNSDEDILRKFDRDQGDEVPESDREFNYRLIEPDVPFPQIRRDIGLSKITSGDVTLCEMYFEIARRARHMKYLAMTNPKYRGIAMAMDRLSHNYVEKIYEILGLRRSLGGFQWEALNKHTKVLEKKQQDQKKGWHQKRENETLE